MLKVSLLWAMLGSCGAWMLETNMSEVMPGSSRDVALTCKQDGGMMSGASTLFKIRITKLDPFGKKFTFVGIDVERGSSSQSDQEAIVTSNTSSMEREVFVKVTWLTASKKTPGAYGCEIYSFDPDGSFVKTDTNQVLITEKVLTENDVKNLIQSATSTYETKLEDLEKESAELKAFINTQLDDIKRQLQNQVANVTVHLAKSRKEMASTFASKNDLALQISTVKNFTSERIDRDDVEDDYKHAKIHDAIQNLTDKCKENYSKLLAGQSELRELIDNETDGFERMENATEREINSKFKDLSNRIEAIDNKYENITNTLASGLDKCEICVPNTPPPTTEMPSQITTSGNLMGSNAWPKGLYGLVKPDTGCPDTGVTNGMNLFVEMSPDTYMQPVEPHDTVTASEFFTSTVSGGTRTSDLRYCVKRADNPGENIPWPAGSYCVASKEVDCASGQDSEVLSFSIYKNGHLHVLVSRYCCQSEGSVDTPIKLPTTTAFYLFRKGNKCQQVEGMKVREDLIQYDAKPEVTLKIMYVKHRTHQADTADKPLRHLCYYWPARHA